MLFFVGCLFRASPGAGRTHSTGSVGRAGGLGAGSAETEATQNTPNASRNRGGPASRAAARVKSSTSTSTVFSPAAKPLVARNSLTR